MEGGGADQSVKNFTDFFSNEGFPNIPVQKNCNIFHCNKVFKKSMTNVTPGGGGGHFESFKTHLFFGIFLGYFVTPGGGSKAGVTFVKKKILRLPFRICI